jgi:hypothetical protein
MDWLMGKQAKTKAVPIITHKQLGSRDSTSPALRYVASDYLVKSKKFLPSTSDNPPKWNMGKIKLRTLQPF